MKIARRFRQQTRVRPTIAVEELVSRLRDTVIIDASWIYGPFNSAGIPLQQRRHRCTRSLPASAFAWFVVFKPRLARARVSSG